MIHGALSDSLEVQILDHLLGNTPMPQPTNWWLALSTANPEDDAAGLSEITGNGYARVDVATWDAAADRLTVNTNTIGYAPATGDWQDAGANTAITHWALFDDPNAATSANLIAYGDFSSTQVVNNGDTYVLGAGDLKVGVLTGTFTNALSNGMLDHIFGVAAYTPPATLFAYLSIADPTDTAEFITEPSVGAGYARLSMTGEFPAATTVRGVARTANQTQQSFPDATAAWGRIRYCGLASNNTVGDIAGVLTYGEVDVPTSISDAVTPATFIPNALAIELD